MKKISLFFVICCLSLAGKAQIQNPVKWSYASKKLNKTEAVIFLKAAIDDGWHIYSTTQKKGGPTKTTFSFKSSKDYKISDKIIEPTPVVHFDMNFGLDVKYHERLVVFQQKVKLNRPSTTVKGKISYMVCNDQKCVTAEDVEFAIPIK